MTDPIHIRLELDPSGLLKLYQDTGQTVMVDVLTGSGYMREPVTDRMAVTSHALVAIAQVRRELHHGTYYMEDPSEAHHPGTDRG